MVFWADLGRPGLIVHTSCLRRTMANLERTFIAIKPDGVQRGLVGEIIKRFELKGFRLVAMKFLRVTTPFAPYPSLLLGGGSLVLPPVVWPRRLLESESGLLAGFTPTRIIFTSAPHQTLVARWPFPRPGRTDALGKVKWR